MTSQRCAGTQRDGPRFILFSFFFFFIVLLTFIFICRFASAFQMQKHERKKICLERHIYFIRKKKKRREKAVENLLNSVLLSPNRFRFFLVRGLVDNAEGFCLFVKTVNDKAEANIRLRTYSMATAKIDTSTWNNICQP